MINPLYVYLQPKIIPHVLEPLKEIPCDKLYIRYYPYPEPHRIARKFFLEHPEYTHLIIHPNDIIITKADYLKLLDDLQRYPFLEVISGVMNVDLEDNKDHLAACFNLPLLNYNDRRYYWIPREHVKGIQRVRHVGFSLTAISRKVIEELKDENGRPGFDGVDPKTESIDGADVWFSNCCYHAGIPIYIDCDIFLVHERYVGEMQVGKKEPHIEFIPYKLTMKELKKYYDTSITIAKPIPLNQKAIDYIISQNPTSVFEFGANWGVNLKAIQEANPSISCRGMDLSRIAIAEAQKQQLMVVYGDERSLKIEPENFFDIVFTVSVLNHIPDEFIHDIIENLKRIAKKQVVLVESNEGKGNNWFSHDYEREGFWSIGSIVSEPWNIRFYYWLWNKESWHIT